MFNFVILAVIKSASIKRIEKVFFQMHDEYEIYCFAKKSFP